MAKGKRNALEKNLQLFKIGTDVSFFGRAFCSCNSNRSISLYHHENSGEYKFHNKFLRNTNKQKARQGEKTLKDECGKLVCGACFCAKCFTDFLKHLLLSLE